LAYRPEPSIFVGLAPNLLFLFYQSIAYPILMKKSFGFLLATVALTVASLNVNAQAPAADIPADMNALMSKYTCIACHRPNQRLVGPAYADVAKKNYTNEKIVDLIYNPVPANWPGYPPMVAMKQVPKEDAMKLAVWINSLDGTPGGGKSSSTKKSSSSTSKSKTTKKA
jgi:cytochrome c